MASSKLAPPPVYNSLPKQQSASSATLNSSSAASAATDKLPRCTSMPGITIAEPSSDSDAGTDDTTVVSPVQGAEKRDDELTEAELRKAFEDEEIERFLGLFSTQTHAVTAAPSTSPPPAPSEIQLPPNISPISTFLLRRLIPLLPTQPPLFSQDPREPFTLTTLQANATRLYVFFPTYSRFFAGLWRVACWEDWGRSARWCLVYWLLWYYNLLLPLLFLRILYSLLRRQYLPYPSLSELRAHRLATREAEEFARATGLEYSAAASSALGAGVGGLGVTEMLGWRVAWRKWREGRRRRKVVERVEGEAGGVEGAEKEAEREVDKEATEEEDGTESGSEEGGAAKALAPMLAVISPAASVESLQSTTTSTTAPIPSTSTSELGTLLAKERTRASKAAAQQASKAQKLAQQETAKQEKEAEKERRKRQKLEERERRALEKERKREEDWRKGLMVALGEMADLHERIKNMFLWRNPPASRTYSIIILFLALFTLFTPAKYIAKTIYALLGFAFFFLVPFLRVMPAADRARLPPAFSDVPTDAQYAYGLIRERAARGESLVPQRDGKAKVKAKDGDVGSLSAVATPVNPATPSTPATSSTAPSEPKAEEKPPNEWEKFIHRGFAFAEDSRRLLRGEPPLSSLSSSTSGAGPGGVGEGINAFPAQHASGALGTLFLSQREMWFQPLAGKEMRISLAEVAGVRKLAPALGFGGGKWGGLEVVLRAPPPADLAGDRPTSDGKDKKENKKESIMKFPFVGKRNEAFALLVASSGQNWLRT